MKFKVIDNSTGEKLKLKRKQMLVMNNDGMLFVVDMEDDYYTYIRKLSGICQSYTVLYARKKDSKGDWIYE